MDTIFALATAQGRAGVAVIRISGPDAWATAAQFCKLPRPRHAALRQLRFSDVGFLDEALVLCFERGASFTGEDVVEFHVHGSIAVTRAVLSCLSSLPAVRMAEPGEFTRRALENGRLDLTQVEALGDLIEAETEAQRLQALRSLDGALGKAADQWRDKLIRAAALIEATIDFADEDVPEDVTPEVRSLITEVLNSISEQRRGFSAAERIRTGFEVAIVGPPNAGKSTLLNVLAGRDAALTSEIAGTTRDVIELRMDLGGLPVTLLDTAGLRETEDQLEQMGIDRARARADAADLRIFLLEPGGAPALPPKPNDIVAYGKCDLYGCEGLGVSGLTGQGIDELIARVVDVLEQRSQQAGLVAHIRQDASLAGAEDGLAQALVLLTQGSDVYELVSEELRFVVRALESLVGRIDVETLLDEIFSRFCLGK